MMVLLVYIYIYIYAFQRGVNDLPLCLCQTLDNGEQEDSSWMVQALQNQTVTNIQQIVARCKRPTAEMRQINEKFAEKLM